MEAFTILLLALLGLISYLLFQFHKDKSYFESRGLPYLGNGSIRFSLNAFRGISFMDDVRIQYDKVKKMGVKMVGTKDFGTPSLWIQDPDILKSVLVKDAEHFVDRRTFPMGDKDDMIQKMLFFVKGEQWKALRNKLSPTFTTGKIRRLTKLMDQSGQRMDTFVTKETKLDNEQDLVDIYSKYTMDVIASVVCGYDSQAFNQKEPSLFEQMGKKMQFQFGGKKALQFSLMMVSSKLGALLGFSFFDAEVTDFFSMAIKSSIKERQKTGVKRDDFLQLLLEAREGKLAKVGEDEIDEFEKSAEIKSTSAKQDVREILNDDTIVANCVLFMLAGYDSVQSLLLFCAYALALNQEVQDKLRDQVDKVLEDNDGEVTYDGMNRMNYLEMVLQETLRYYPPAPLTDRGCTQDYKVPGTDITLKKGEGVAIPIFGLHHDPEYFPNPEKFDPERFSTENKPNINQYAFLPFGQGPRNCIGMRFALAEVKIAIIHLVHNFKIEPSKRTLIPMKFANTSSLKPEGGMFLSLTKIR